MVEDETRRDQVLIPPPLPASAPLPFVLQRQLNFAAGRLAEVQDADELVIGTLPEAPLVRSRWWIANRLSRDCSPVFTIMNPVLAKNIAFVSVKAGHWGTTYAFAKRGAKWAAIGQWSNWLY